MSIGQAPSLPPALQNRGIQIGIAVFVLVLLIAIGIIFWANSSSSLGSYKPLLKGIEQFRAVEIGSFLDKGGIEYEIVQSETGGNTINVREKQYDLAVLRLAGNDALEADDFDLFDKSDWAASGYDKRIKFMRAISGKISRIISRMDGIKNATVHIDLPEKKLFASKKEQPSANVTLQMQPGRILTGSQTAGIINIVRGYKAQIASNNISIVDTSGRVYSSINTAEDGGWEGNNTSQGEMIAVENRVQSYLDSIVGFGKSKVAISMRTLNAKTTRKSTTFLPGAIGTHEYSEEAMGDSAAKEPFKGMADYRYARTRPNPQDEADFRLKKGSDNNIDIPQSGNQSPPSSTKQKGYICSDGDDNCRRNYRQHNFLIKSYPSYEQVITEQPPGNIQQMKVSVVIEENAMPRSVSLPALKRGIAAAADPDLLTSDVEIITRPPLNEVQENPKQKKFFQKILKTPQGSFPWKKILFWIAMVILGIIVLGIVLNLLKGVLGSLGDLFRRRSTTRTQNNNPLDNYNSSPSPRRSPLQAQTPPSPPPPKTPPPPAPTPELAPTQNSSSIPFDLEDELSGGALADDFSFEDDEKKEEQQAQTPQKPAIVIEDK